jgi:ElaB/YqjD/DUF883 family membrane-anchored ribosome-binding protein
VQVEIRREKEMDEQLNREIGQEQQGRCEGGDYGTAGSSAANTATRIKEQASQKASQVKEKVADLGRKAGDKIEEQRMKAAGTLENTASTLHERGDRLASRTSNAMHATADKIQSASDYLREHDAQAMMADFQGLVRRYPGQALAAAAVIGFLAGRALRSSD